MGIVAAVASAASTRSPEVTKAVEEAMAQAIIKATEDGLATGREDHQPEIKKRMMEARLRVLREFNYPSSDPAMDPSKEDGA